MAQLLRVARPNGKVVPSAHLVHANRGLVRYPLNWRTIGLLTAKERTYPQSPPIRAISRQWLTLPFGQCFGVFPTFDIGIDDILAPVARMTPSFPRRPPVVIDSMVPAKKKWTSRVVGEKCRVRALGCRWIRLWLTCSTRYLFHWWVGLFWISPLRCRRFIWSPTRQLHGRTQLWLICGARCRPVCSLFRPTIFLRIFWTWRPAWKPPKTVELWARRRQRRLSRKPWLGLRRIQR